MAHALGAWAGMRAPTTYRQHHEIWGACSTAEHARDDTLTWTIITDGCSRNAPALATDCSTDCAKRSVSNCCGSS